MPHAHDELAPIGDKPATNIFNRYAILNDDETPSEEEDGESSAIKVPIEEFIRPTRKKLKNIKYLINAKMNQHAACAEGCKCEDASREEFPAIVEPSHIPGLPEAAMSGLEGSVAKTFASVILPARSETAVSGHKGSVASAGAEVK